MLIDYKALVDVVNEQINICESKRDLKGVEHYTRTLYKLLNNSANEQDAKELNKCFKAMLRQGKFDSETRMTIVDELKRLKENKDASIEYKIKFHK